MYWKKLLIKNSANLKETLKRMDEGAEKILFAVNKDNIVKGVITDGDIRRHFLRHGTLNANISQICNTKFVYAKKDCKKKDIKKLMLEKKIEVMPVLDDSGHIIGALSWPDIFGSGSFFAGGNISVPVVIMAGGRGERLAPFTKILPKALIPIGEKPIIEIIMDKFNSCGVKKFYVTL
ncbi:MAG: CBS domain-containing protein, partial [Candidatus Omnitrophica bacterium]|nr:CBS domain-containing protein [Candidatus Omnitrophota bacterium]